MRRPATNELWIAVAALAGFLVTYVLVDRMRLTREWFVLGHVVLTGTLLALYFTLTKTRWNDLVGSWPRGLLGAAVAGALMIGFVLTGQSSPPPTGLALVWAIVWLGAVYGAIDALLLSVFPVAASRWIGGSDLLAAEGGLKPVSLVALGVSLVLTVTYHLGFPEFRGAAMVSALIGNGIMTLSYLGTGSALAPILAHIALHIAAVTYGYANALPAPPHY
jgi:hypothetical protein